MSTISKIRDYQKTYGFFKSLPIILKRRINSKKAKKDIKKYLPIFDKKYSPFLEKYKSIRPSETLPNRIFFFWYDGFDNMPAIPKICFNRLKDLYSSDYEIIFVDKNNFSKLVNMDDIFIHALNLNKITIQTFSDILRFYLMNQIGGIWIDSTIYLPYKIEFTEIAINGFYTLNTTCSQTFLEYKNKHCCWSGFLFGTSINHPISAAMIQLFTIYIKENQSNSIYFLIDIFIMLLHINNISSSCIDSFGKNYKLNYDFLFLSNNLSKKVTSLLEKEVNKGPQKLNWRIKLNKYKKDSLINAIINEGKKNEI